MFVAWVHSCTDSENGYVKWLAALRSGNSEFGIEFVSQDPEAERHQYHVDPDPFPGGIMDPRRGGDFVRVSESVGEGRLPPGMRSVKVARKGRENYSANNFRSLDGLQGSGLSADEVKAQFSQSAETRRQQSRR